MFLMKFFRVEFREFEERGSGFEEIVKNEIFLDKKNNF